MKMMPRSFALAGALIFSPALYTIAMADVEIRQVTPATRVQIEYIRKADKQLPAIANVEKLRHEANRLLGTRPQPLAVIQYEGLLNTDSRRVASEQALADMDRLAVLCQAYAATGEVRYAEKAQEFLLAWVKTYVPNGNTINENKLEPVFWGFDLLRDRFSADEQKLVEAWLRQIAEKQITVYAHRQNEAGNGELHNWDSKRFKMVGIIGQVLGQPQWVQYGTDGFKDYIARGLFPDGTSVDLKTRDALSYHVSGLRPLLVVALWAEVKKPGEGLKLLDYQAESGASLRKSIDYVVTYAQGEKQRAEWRNSKVALDHQRAAAGIAGYQPGKLYDPLKSLSMFELAALLDPKYTPIVQQLSEKKEARDAWLWLLRSSSASDDRNATK